MAGDRDSHHAAASEFVAGGGLLHRRALLLGGAVATGGLALRSAVAVAAPGIALSIGEGQPETMRMPGAAFTEYGQPSRFESVKRSIRVRVPDLAPGTGVSLAPLQHLRGAITPNGLHFVRNHNGTPEIDPAKHELLIHGLVERPIVLDMNALMRYPMVSRLHFIECTGNSSMNGNILSEAPQVSVDIIHGLVSSAEWTGIPLSILLDEAGVRPAGRWVLAEGADAAGMSRSIPLKKCMDDAMIALYQNGERVRPEQGYPMRLLLPGFEGNMCVKWLRRLKVTADPTHTKDETSKYTDLLPDGKARQFTFAVGVKSVICNPAAGLEMQTPGFYEISGIAWSGHGRVTKVEISADGGKSWAEAALSQPDLPLAMRRFALPWKWDGQPSILMSRATDDKGNVQPTRTAWGAQYGAAQGYHCNAIQSWAINSDGRIRNVFA